METEKKFKELSLYPLDYPFKTLIANIDEWQLILDPEFQRKYKWDKNGNSRPSKFIESCLMRIPLPVAYFSEEDDGNYLVIDWVQRLTTIKNFFENQFELEDLLVFDDLNWKRFCDLAPVYQRDLQNYTMRCIILRRDNPKYIISDIFARLNQWGVQLSQQEIRHAIFPWSLDHLLQELWKREIIQSFWGRDKSSLEHEELILRFFAMRWNLTDYDDKLHKYLDVFMMDHQQADVDEISGLRSLFIETLDKCSHIFGKDVFINPGSKKKKQSIVYYDLLMRSFQDQPFTLLSQNKVAINNSFIDMCSNNKEFIKTLSWWLWQKSQILKRRAIWKEYLNKAIS